MDLNFYSFIHSNFDLSIIRKDIENNKNKSMGRIFSELLRIAIPFVDFDLNEAVSALVKREKFGSTAAGGGVAFPHSRIESIIDFIIIAYRLKNPIKWPFNSMDGKPVFFIILILMPKYSYGQHHLILSRIYRDAFKNNTNIYSSEIKFVSAIRKVFESMENVKILKTFS